jgi:L-alanine-DL-glutamate epimerase-like enolase superfamily enzyme
MDWNDDIWVEPAIPKNGMLKPPETPGHGVRFKPELLKDNRIGGIEVHHKG